METKAINEIREEFQQNPSGFLDYSIRRHMRAKGFREKYLHIPHSQAICLLEQEDFFRLRGLGDAAYRAASQPGRHAGALLCGYASDYHLMREHITQKNIGLPYAMLAKFRSNADPSDLESDALFGLARAVDKFDPFLGYRFSTYACNIIARALMRTGQSKTAHSNIWGTQLEPEVEPRTHTPSTNDNTSVLAEKALAAIEIPGLLTDFERDILTKRFLNGNGAPRPTFREIGDTVGLSKERIRQIQALALSKLRSHLEEETPEYVPSFSNN